jgi:hypothetical protein
VEDQEVEVDNSICPDRGVNKKRAVYSYTRRVFKSPYRILGGAHLHHEDEEITQPQQLQSL